MIFKRISKFNNEKGNISLIFAGMFVTFLLMIATIVDVGLYYADKTRVNNVNKIIADGRYFSFCFEALNGEPNQGCYDMAESYLAANGLEGATLQHNYITHPRISSNYSEIYGLDYVEAKIIFKITKTHEFSFLKFFGYSSVEIEDTVEGINYKYTGMPEIN